MQDDLAPSNSAVVQSYDVNLVGHLTRYVPISFTVASALYHGRDPLADIHSFEGLGHALRPGRLPPAFLCHHERLCLHRDTN